MYDILIIAGLMVGWIVLNIWVLPVCGIQTCMSGACRVPRVKQIEAQGLNHKAIDER